MSPPRSRRRRPAAAAAASVIAAGLLLTGCAGSTADAAPETAPPSTAAAAAFPVTVDNCGVKVTIDAPPQRIVTIKSSTLELLLSLGVGDRIVGSAFSDGPLPANLESADEGIPVISDKVPGQEATLALEPDLIFAGWESNLTAEGAGDRATLATLGVATYVAPSACKEKAYMPDPLTFDDVFDEFLQAGRIVGAAPAAEKLVADQRAALKKITPDKRELTAVWYSSGTKTPYVGAGIGAPEMIMSAAGLTNIFADVHNTWTSASWEAVAEKNPDVIVLVDATWNTAAAKIALLEQNPVTAQMDAVKNKRFVTVDFPASEAGVRNVDAVASIVSQVKGQ